MTARIMSTVIFFAAASAFPQSLPCERVLLPVFGTVNGAYGSVWHTELIGYNEGAPPVDFATCLPGLSFEHPVFPPGRTFRPPVADTFGNPVFVYVPQPGADKVRFNLRVQDVSRQAQTWGTTIPVVHESDIFSGPFELLDVPVDARFRSGLRIYDWDSDGADPRLVRVRIYDLCGLAIIGDPCSDVPLIDTTIAVAGEAFDGGFPIMPAFTSISDLVGAFPPLANVKPQLTGPNSLRPAAVRIELEPITPGLRIWAFVSATNNDTQHVTVIAPSR